jgi:hypothetical protein
MEKRAHGNNGRKSSSAINQSAPADMTTSSELRVRSRFFSKLFRATNRDAAPAQRVEEAFVRVALGRVALAVGGDALHDLEENVKSLFPLQRGALAGQGLGVLPRGHHHRFRHGALVHVPLKVRPPNERVAAWTRHLYRGLATDMYFMFYMYGWCDNDNDGRVTIRQVSVKQAACHLLSCHR